MVDLINTLNEISLRYALKTIPDTPARRDEMEAWHAAAAARTSEWDYRDQIMPLMETTFVKEQVVNVQEQVVLPV